MKRFAYVMVLLGVAVSLPAQTLSFGEMTVGANGARLLDVVLTSNGALVSGLQFDVNYDTTQLNVVIGPGASASAASKEVSTNMLPSQFNPSTTAPNTAKGQRAIVTGVGLNDASVSNTAGATASGTNMANGVVAILTITPTGGTFASGQTITLTNLAGTTLGATAVNLAVGAGAIGISGTVDLYHTFVVGGLSPATTTTAPNFGSGKLALNDLILELLYQTGAPGYALPQACTDFFDALDTSPADTDTGRGGDGQITLNDLILELLRQTGAPGYGAVPVRMTKGNCIGTTTANIRTAPLQTEVRGRLVLGPVQGAGTSQERVPVYLEGIRDLTHVGVAFSVGDGQSQLMFQPGSAGQPSLSYASQPGFVAVAFLDGLDVRGGDRALLGYIAGPAGSAANMKVFGTSATSLRDGQVFTVDFSGPTVVRQ